MGAIETGRYDSRDGTRLYWESRLPEGPARAHVAVIHGYGDHVGRYGELLDTLASHGFAAHGFDYRGHGRAEGRRGHCVRFTEFHDDLEIHLAAVRKRAAGAPVFAFAHSHGALVTASYAIERGLDVGGLVLSAPWFDMAHRAPRLKLLAARVLRRIAPQVHLRTEIRFDQLSRDPAWQETTRMDPLYLRTVTPGWFFEARKAQKRVREGARALTVPLAVHHGTDDQIASLPAARAFVDAAGSAFKAFTPWEGYRHELVAEVGRQPVLDAIVGFYAARC